MTLTPIRKILGMSKMKSYENVYIYHAVIIVFHELDGIVG